MKREEWKNEKRIEKEIIGRNVIKEKNENEMSKLRMRNWEEIFMSGWKRIDKKKENGNLRKCLRIKEN